jgi:SAM-dependent methyltransferase
MMNDWKGYDHEGYRFEFPPGALILDVGCGVGGQLVALRRGGCLPLGLDVSMSRVLTCRAQGFDVFQSRAERIPLASASVDGVICKVVVPYTDENEVISEIGRIMKPGAKCYLISHGAGYYLRYLLRPPSGPLCIYGLRALVNTVVWRVTGRRLPGFLGDTIFQSRGRLSRYFARSGLNLQHDIPSKPFLAVPVFIYQVLEKAG